MPKSTAQQSWQFLTEDLEGVALFFWLGGIAQVLSLSSLPAATSSRRCSSTASGRPSPCTTFAAVHPPEADSVRWYQSRICTARHRLRPSQHRFLQRLPQLPHFLLHWRRRLLPSRLLICYHLADTLSVSANKALPCNNR